MDIDSIAEVEEPKLEMSGIFSRGDSVELAAGNDKSHNSTIRNNPEK